MIFGETNAQRFARFTTPQLWFAWHPVMLNDDRFAWLRRVVRYRRYWDRSLWGGRGCEISAFWTYEEKP